MSKYIKIINAVFINLAGTSQFTGFGRWRDAQRRRWDSLPFIDFSCNANNGEKMKNAGR